MTAPDTWLDIMPAIPLARGVPVALQEKPDTRGVCTGVVDDWPHVRWDHSPQPYDLIQHGRCVAHWLRADLDDPLGFIYMVGWLGRRRGILNGDLLDLMERYIVGGTTDADRLALARACREVLS